MSPMLPLWGKLYFNEWSDSIGFLWATSSWFCLCLALCSIVKFGRWLHSGSPVSLSFAASDALHTWGCSLPSQSSFVTCAHRLLDMALLEKPVCSVHLCLPLHTSAPLGSEFQVPSDFYETRYSRGVHLGSFKSNGACTFNLFPDSLAYYMSPCTWLQNGVFPFFFLKAFFLYVTSSGIICIHCSNGSSTLKVLQPLFWKGELLGSKALSLSLLSVSVSFHYCNPEQPIHCVCLI